MLFYKALLAILASTADVWALPVLGDSNGLLNGLTGKLHGVVGKAPLNINKLDDIFQQLLNLLEGIKHRLNILEIRIPEINDVNGIVDGASAMIPEPVSGVVDTVQNTASGVVDTAAGVVPGPVSDALNEVKDAAVNIGNDAVNMIPHPSVVDEALNAASDPVNTIVDAANN
ncbi:hypothetical protein L5515_012791 [Caenorhabditis briggsae]|uniref:Uncharacterized protein n=2 Tax=Caenorhabditis briggsae TaxID=6238 RepID=A0AAE9F223_CAEBR|nr:hypothetical protein L5515_012791 [Caenorhabditis briggsae]